MRVELREVLPEDMPVHFEQQRDPESVRLTGVPARDRAAFDAHWRALQADPAAVLLTVLADGEVAGSALSFHRNGEQQVGYRLGREHWGRGIATAALDLLLGEHVAGRPLSARVAEHNPASQRVLAKCGFVPAGDEMIAGVRYLVMRLA